MCYALAALDDETLEYLAGRPNVVKRLYERSASAFAAAGDHLRVRGDTVVTPGGEGAVAIWEAAIGEKVTRPDRFIPQLFESERGRIAYVFDTMWHADRPRLAFAMGDWLPNRQDGAARFQRLIAVAKRAFPEWDINIAPFARPAADLSAVMARVQVDSNGQPSRTLSAAFWQRVFDDTAEGAATASDEARVDIGWLAEEILARPPRDREPVHQAERRGDQPADDARGDERERDRRGGRGSGRKVDDVEDDRRREQTEREDDQHLVDGMPEQLDPAFHVDLRSDPMASMASVVPDDPLVRRGRAAHGDGAHRLPSADATASHRSRR